MRPATPRAVRGISLSKPGAGKPGSVMRALQDRKTVREFSARKLPGQLLSDLLWAAFGVNRRRGPFGAAGRTAGSASNSQEIDLYVALEEGVFLYEPRRHRLAPVVSEDLRRLALSPGQAHADPGAMAPVRLIFVADVGRLEHTAGFDEPGLRDPQVQRSYYYVDTGLIAANVYLFAAAQGLAAWFHNCDRTGLTRALALRPPQRVLFAQTVGYAMRPPRRTTR